MGKISTNDSRKNEKPRHDPLYKELTTQGGNLRVVSRDQKQSSKRSAKKENKDEEFIDATSSRKILQLAKEQQDEVAEEENRNEEQNPRPLKFMEYEESEEDEDEYSNFGSDEEYEIEEEVEIDENDAALFDQYFKGESFNLADKIMAKIHEKESMKSAPIERPVDAVLLPPKVIETFETVGSILKSWKHGKLPKVFKVIPSLSNWQDILFVTNPEAWTPHAVYEATKLFVSNLTAKEAQKFIEMVLLERFRNDIADSEDHSLNYHIYRALKKALYKPSAFFKGFLIPLVQSGCNIREATIAASVLAKISVPGNHSAAALSQLVKLDFNPATTVFIRVLIEKKYALPYQTLDDCVFYFMNFRKAAQENRNFGDEMMDEDEDSNKKLPPLPVVWHKAFLAFAQRYKNDITDDQRDFLLDTVRQRFHKDIGPEIRRELLAGKPRMPAQIQEREALMVDAF